MRTDEAIDQYRARRQQAASVIAISGRKARTLSAAASDASGGAEPGGAAPGSGLPSGASGATAGDATVGFLLNRSKLNVEKVRA